MFLGKAKSLPYRGTPESFITLAPVDNNGSLQGPVLQSILRL
jgi:hypothetical protein